MLNALAGTVAVATAAFLIGQAAVIFLRPALARRFLEAFASTARAHYTEQGLRLVAGAGLVLYAPSMWLPELFALFGWVVVATSAALLLVPWRWHRKFAGWAIPLAVRHLKLYGAGSLALGAFVLYGAARPLFG